MKRRAVPARLPALAFAAAAFAIATTGRLPAAPPPDSSPTLAPATNLPESRTAAPATANGAPYATFPPFGGRATTAASSSPSVAPQGKASATPSASASASPSASPSPQATATAAPPAEISIRGQVLSLGSGYLVFTTGQAVRVADAVRLPDHTPIGIFVRATLQTASRTVSAIAFQPKTALPGEVDASKLPPQYLASSVESLPSVPPIVQAGPLAKQVTVRINVNVPYNTPQTDDVYVATDRSNFGSAEVRMARVDLHRWTVQISLESGSTLRYQFTRGFNTTVERDRLGGIADPRAVTVTEGLTTDDTVQRWADIQ